MIQPQMAPAVIQTKSFRYFFYKFFVANFLVNLIKLNLVQDLTVGAKIIGNFCIREVALSSLAYEYILSCFTIRQQTRMTAT